MVIFYDFFSVINNEFIMSPMPNTYQQPQQNLNFQQFMSTTSNDMSTVIDLIKFILKYNWY